jgi:hypothetical protein
MGTRTWRGKRIKDLRTYRRYPLTERTHVLPLGTNWSAAIAFMASFMTAIAISEWTGAEGEGPGTLLGGALVFLVDVVHRRRFLDCRLADFEAGTRLLYVPLWIWGVIWIVLGGVRWVLAAL